MVADFFMNSIKTAYFASFAKLLFVRLYKLKIWSLQCLSIVIMLLGCANNKSEDATSIINKSIKAHGGAAYNELQLSFNFRVCAVELRNKGGQYSYVRRFKDSANNSITDQLTNTGFTRKINEVVIPLDAKQENAFRESINSVAYFALLPYKLSEPAVQSKLAGEIAMEGKNYYKIIVTFKKDGGGKDHTDEFCYWINKANYNMEYIAYSNGGPRFRKLIRQHKTEAGVLLQDYQNFAMTDTTISVISYDSAFLKGKMELLSLIEHNNVK